MGTYEAREKALVNEAAKFAHAEQQEIKKGKMQEGMPYRSLRKTIIINLLDLILFSQNMSWLISFKSHYV
ncbi:hypothetical protein [Bacillus wiedmannii]|uniref:hypothetical protein n=1 Tax=Bacillus wiedmannii TaxID=1890302 RepID=UPI0030D4A7F5